MSQSDLKIQHKSSSTIAIRGRLERCDNRTVIGWVYNSENSEERVLIEILLDQVVVASATADIFRGDLFKAGIGDGKHAFNVTIPTNIANSFKQKLMVRVHKTQFKIPANTADGLLEVLLPPVVTGIADVFHAGYLFGHAYSSTNSSNPLRISLCTNDGTIKSVDIAERPNIQSTTSTNLPQNCSFKIRLSGEEFVDLLEGKLKLVADLYDYQIPLSDGISCTSAITRASSTELCKDCSFNAIENGSFEDWSLPLVRNITARRLDVANGWTVAAKPPASLVQCKLTSLKTRDVSIGNIGKESYALALYGPIDSGYLRLESRINTSVLTFASSLKLTFYVVSYESYINSTNSDSSRIAEIFIMRRTYKDDAKEKNLYSDTKLLKITKNFQITLSGRNVSISLSDNQSSTLCDAVRQIGVDGSTELFLCFEWSRYVNVIITDISLSPQFKENPTFTDNDDFEDANIARQLEFLRIRSDWEQATVENHINYQPVLPNEYKWSWPEINRSVDIVIPIFNAIKDVLKCLDSLERCTSMPHRVVLVNDASDRHIREQLKSYASKRPWVHLINNDNNLGYTRSANIGMAASTSDWIVLLNSDTIVTNGWLQGLFDVAEVRPNAALIGPVSNAASWQSVPDLHDANGKWCINPLPRNLTVEHLAEIVRTVSDRKMPYVPLLNGFCTLMKRNAIERVGYLDEIAFPVGYGEENDLCVRIRKAGYDLVVADHVYVYHEKSASFGIKQRDELSKAGTASFLRKHPQVDIRALERQYSEITELIELRVAVRNALIRY